MALFYYKVRDESGRMLHGLLEAPARKEVKRRLSAGGYYYLSAEEYDINVLFRHHASLQTLKMFTHRLTSLVEGGIPILSALNILWRQTEDKSLQLMICYLKMHLEEGNRISDAMNKFPGIFPPVYRSLIKVAEMGGALAGVLRRLSEFLEYQAQLISRTKRALLYPCIVVGFSIIVTIGMFTLLVPTFEKVLLKLNVELPLLTRMIIGLSHLMRSWIFWGVIFVLLLIFWTAYRQLRSNPRFSLVRDGFLLRIPYFGDIIFSIALSRFIRSLGVLLGAGLPILESLTVAKETAGNQLIVQGIDRVKSRIEQGGSLYQSFKGESVFPVMLHEMIGIGESSGTLITTLEKMTKHFDEEIDYKLSKFLTFLEPCLIVLIGVIVLITLLSVYLPIFSIWQGLIK